MRRTLVLYSRLLVLITSDVTIVKDSDHWILEEKPEETISALVRFLQEGLLPA